MTTPIEKFLMHVGDEWLLKVFWPSAQLTVTLQRTDDESPLAVTQLNFSPTKCPSTWLDEVRLDDLVADAIWQAGKQEDRPEFQAVRWTHQTRPGRPMPDSLLREVVRLRQSMSAQEIGHRLDRSRSQVFRYLEIARERGITAEGEADGSN
jgi:hypothetical protein